MNKRTTIFISIGVVIVAALISFFIYTFEPLSEALFPTPTPKSPSLQRILYDPKPNPSTQAPTITPTLLNEQASLSIKAKLQIPEVLSFKITDKSTLPSDLGDIIHYQAANIVVKDVVFKDKQMGWVISASESDALAQVAGYYLGLLSRSPWKFISGRYGVYAGMVEAQDTSYVVRVSLAQPDNSIKKVSLLIEIVKQ